MHEPLEIAFTVSCSPRHAFDVWTTRTSQWWPDDHTRSGNPQLISIEGRVGGRIFERTANGEQLNWGEVVEWDPPHKLTYLWHIYGDQADATMVEVSFKESGSNTTVLIVHTGWERLEPRAEEIRKRNHSAWEKLIPHFRNYIGADEGMR